MLIVEGIDGSGKTTLIRLIQAVYPDLEISPRVVSKETEALTDLVAWVNENLTVGPQYKIFDRHRLISEFIYGPTLRDVQQPGFTSARWVVHSLRRFYQIEPVIIYCIPPLEVVRSNLRDDQSNRMVWDKVDALYTAYLHRAAHDYLYHNAIIYDYTQDGQLDDPLFRLHSAINNLHERVYQ